MPLVCALCAGSRPQVGAAGAGATATNTKAWQQQLQQNYVGSGEQYESQPIRHEILVQLSYLVAQKTANVLLGLEIVAAAALPLYRSVAFCERKFLTPSPASFEEIG
jgi:hypothetical protein